MLCCFGEIGVFIVGIVLLVRGTINLTPSRVVRGAPARVIGVLLMLPLVLGQGSEAVYGFAIGAQTVLEIAVSILAELIARRNLGRTLREARVHVPVG